MNKRLGSIALLSLAFFMWGFLTSLNDILIPHLKALFELNYTQAMFVQFVFFAAYAVLSVPLGKLVFKFGHKWSIVLGFFITMLACFLFIPAAYSSLYAFFLFSLIILGGGITLLQVAANPYASLLGNPKTAASRLTLMQALNSLGTTVGPLFGSVLILSVAVNQASHRQLVESIEKPYLILGSVMLILGLLFTLFPLQKVEGTMVDKKTKAHLDETGYKYTFRQKHLYLGCIAIFVYVGAEVSIGSFLVNYFERPFIGGLTAAQAAKYVAFYWGGAMIGRFIGSFFLKIVKPPKLLSFNAIVAMILVIISISSSYSIAMWSILAVGLFNSIMFPTIFGLAHRELHHNSTYGSALLCTSIVGGAIIPIFQGVVADYLGIQIAFIIPVICYGYILFYGLYGYNKNISLG
ncbi:sugar MFS transporter [Facilibium subflavum]|uniref:sugar MFS transporter n=1 Tax=Facilibium subflavum TaxID=2219058 RepID=UPI001AAD2EBB|nr:sugar MFS transporter [Facilibium subflavum]